VRGYRGIGLVEIGINQRIAREAECHGAVSEKIDVLRADNMRELESWLALDEGALMGGGRGCG
jgi:hypothetical protein